MDLLQICSFSLHKLGYRLLVDYYDKKSCLNFHSDNTVEDSLVSKYCNAKFIQMRLTLNVIICNEIKNANAT